VAIHAEVTAPRVVARGDSAYPESLLDLEDPPDPLFVRGRWPLPPGVALVGSRAASPYGLAIAERLAGDLARLGLVVVSGFAHGIDAAAHRGALAAGGATLAVLPGGLDHIVPRAHEPLAREVAGRGALVSERPPGAAPYKSSFLERNRLIAALARAVVVVEAGIPSGALSTAGHARRLGRPLLTVPGDVDRVTSRGCHALLRTGAALCEGVADVLAALPPEQVERSESSPGEKPPTPESGAGRLLAVLGNHPETLERCAARAGVGLPEAQAALLELEWAGLARAVPGGRWVGRGASR